MRACAFANTWIAGETGHAATSQAPHCSMNETFDYVIVGAGSAGCVLANRLTRGRPRPTCSCSNMAGRIGRSSSRCRPRCRSR